MKKIIGLCVLMLMVGGIAYDAVAMQALSIDHSPDKRLHEMIKAFVAANNIPGLAIAIVKNNELYFANAYGVKNLDTKEPVTTESIFHMASVSKPFTATAIMQLVEKGKINLDDPLIKYLPYFKLDDPRYKEITIKQMLTHTSGLPDIQSSEWYNPQYDDGAAERYVRSLTKERLWDAPGQLFFYSNLAFDILADVIAKVSGMTFEDYIKTNILNPLEMTESDFLIKRIKPGLRTSPHIFPENWQVSPVYPYNRRHASSSCLNSNVLEMSHWAIANMNRGIYKGKRILSESSYALLFENQIKSVTTENVVGLSWFLGQYHGFKTIGHAGKVTGFRSYLIMIPEKNIAVMIASNSETGSLGRLAFVAQYLLINEEQDKKTSVLPPSIMLSIPNTSSDPDGNRIAWAGETCVQMALAYYNKNVTLKTIYSAGKSEHEGLWSKEIDTALDTLGVAYVSWNRENPDLAEFLTWIKTNLAKGYPVLCGIKINPTIHPEFFCDSFALIIGYNEGGLFIDTNKGGDGRIFATYSQLASFKNRYSFENKYFTYYGSAFLGIKDNGLLAKNQELKKNVVSSPIVNKPVPQLKPVVVDSSRLKRLTGRYTPGGQARIITFDGEKLFSHWEGENVRTLVPLSETEFRFADSETRLRFELTGDKVIGVIRCPANAPADPLEKRVEPIEDKDPKVTALVQQYIRESIDGTLKREIFTNSLAAQIFPDQVKEAGIFLKWLGPQTGIELYECEEQGGGRRYLYRLSYRDKVVAVRLSVLEDNRISRIDFFLE